MYYCITYCQQFLTMAFADNSTQTWSQKETKVLISIWSNEKILQKLERSYRKKPVYGEISERLNEHGFKRTWKQCQIKIKDLKFLYRRARMKPSNSRPSPFFAKLKEFLGDIDDPPLPLPSLRLFVPPLRLVSAALWQVVQQGDIMDYGLVEEFVTTVLEVVPDMMSYREKVQLVMGLRAKLVLELCRSEQSADPETIQPHLSRIRTFIMTHTEKEIPDPEVEASETKFLELVQTLLVNPKMREHFFQEVFPVEFGPMYDTALQTLMWEFLSRLEKLLPTPTFQETASWLRPAPSLLKECAQTVTQPHPLKTLLLHHRCHSPLFSNVQPSCVNDHILSSLSQILPEKVEIDIYGIRSESTYSPRNCPIHNNDGATVKEENNVENELGMNSDIVIKKPVEITNVRTEDLEEKHYEEILSHDKPVDVVKVEVVDADDVSQTSSTTHIVGRSWSLEETKALITIWSNEEILQKFGKWYRNKHVYTEISQLLNDLGFKRTWKQCQTKIKDMKYSYRRALKNPSSSSPVSFSFFSELHTFLSRMPYLPGSKETGQVSDGEEMSMDQDEGPSVDVYLEEPLHEEITSREVTQKTVTAEETDKIKGHEAFHSFQSHSMKIEVETPSCKQAMEDVSELNLQPVVLLPRIHDNILMTVHPSCVNDPILSSLPHLVSEKLKMDIDETCVESGCTPGTCTMYNNESDTLKEENCAGNELGVCLEMTDVSNKDLEEDYGEMLKNHKPADLANVGIEDVSQTSSTTHIVGRSWSLEETKALITIWSNEEILQKFGKWYRNKHVYTEISQLLNDLGFKRTWKQCQTKIKDMKYSYRRALKNPSNSSPVSFSFFSELHTFLSRMPYLPGSKETGQVSDGEEMSMDQDEGPSVDVYLEEPPRDKMSCRKATEKTVNGEQTEESKCDEAVQSPQSDSKINFSRQSHCCDPKVEDQSELPLSEKELMSSTSVTLSIDDRRAQNCNWTTDETKMLISLWSNKPILQELQHSYRKHHVYLNISKQLNNLGYKKTWKQCQTKIKDMKYSYRRALRNPKSSGRVPCSFYSELHAFLSVMPDSKERGVVSGGEVMSLDQNDNVDVNSEDSPLEEMASGKETRKTLRAEQTEEIKGDGAFHSPRSDEVICMERETNTCQQVAEDFKPLVLLPQLQSNVPRTRDASFSHSIRGSLKRSKRNKKCSLCGRSFVTGNDLMKHMRTHTEQSPHQCTKCGEGFEHLHDLQKHQQNECEEMNQQEVNEPQLGKKDWMSRLSSTDSKTCQLCHKTFKFQYLLRRHLILFHKGKSLFKCPLCLKGFAFLSALKKHQSNKRGCPTSEGIKKRRELGPKPSFGHVIKRCFKCPRCLKAFVSHSQLKRHQENKRGCGIERVEKNGRKQAWTLTPGENSKDIPQPSSLATEEPTTSYALTTSAHSSNKKTIPKACPICHKAFTFKATMIRHIASHQKESLNKCPDILKCNFCKETFSRGMELKIHYSRVHQFTGQFPCPSCQKTFFSLTELRIHQRNEPMPYKCSVCQRFFRTQKTLTIHERIHTGEKPFVCAECGKGFRIEKLLQSHSETHVESKPHDCLTCGRRFKREALLKQHMLHHKDASFVCPDCGKKFFQLTWLRRHMFMHTGERPFLCDVCGKGFKSRAELKLHTMNHTGERPFKCPECGKGCRQKSELQLHRRRHTGDRPYPCSMCDKRFYCNKDKERHMITHTGERPYKCQACGMAFKRRVLLSVHQNKSCM